MTKRNLVGLTCRQLEDLMVEMGQPCYRGRQLFRWVYHAQREDFSQLTDMSKELRARLAETFTCEVFKPETEVTSVDGTTKCAFRLADGHVIESVLIPDDESGRRTVCVSSQAGCPLGCSFCATGMLGFHRNLTVGEILSQLLHLRQRFGPEAFSNIVLMGMGEPMLNLDNILDAVGIVSDGAALAHSAKKITISTAGVIPGIRRLAEVHSKVRLAVSLNAAIQAKRERIMPIASRYSLEQLHAELRKYTASTRTRVTFEYAVFEGFNDGADDIAALIQYAQGIPCKINVLAYNPVDGAPFRPPSPEVIDRFVQKLYPHVPAVTVRRSRGADIEAACGQLAGRAERSNG